MKKYNLKTTDSLDELHDIVDEKNKIIGKAKRIEFLENKELIRRSSHIWLKNFRGQFWFQQRSKNKDLQPLHWSCSAAGFVSAGKDNEAEIMEEAKRELGEELGIDAGIKLKKIYLHRSRAIGGIMVYLFFGHHDGPFKFNKDELADVKAFDPKHFNQLYKDGKIKITDPTISELQFILSNKQAL